MFMRRLLAVLLLSISLPLQAADTYRETTWEELIPKDWDPAKEFRSLDLANMKDSDPRAMAALQRMKELWEQAPTEPSMTGRKVPARLRDSARTQGEGRRVPAGPLLRRMHSHATAAGQSDHPCRLGQTTREDAQHGCRWHDPAARWRSSDPKQLGAVPAIGCASNDSNDTKSVEEIAANNSQTFHYINFDQRRIGKDQRTPHAASGEHLRHPPGSNRTPVAGSHPAARCRCWNSCNR